jgi:hypothetical protein
MHGLGIEAAVWAMMQDYEQSFEFGAPLVGS